jgi:glycosyltransferase involved in cell wall biosynthesis
MSDITFVILTFNEEQHIERCIRSAKKVSDKIIIVDSCSNDNTVNLAEKLGAKIVTNPWVNYATQFNFALDNCDIDTNWIFRLDADEVISESLVNSLLTNIPTVTENVSGFYVKRRIDFLGKAIKYGGIYPGLMLRLFRKQHGRCEVRWMDEHIQLSQGDTECLEGDLVDDNLNNLTWWSEKHASYAKREMVDLLNLRYKFFDTDGVKPKLWGLQSERKRWLKLRYSLLPLFLRPFIYFFYRYFVRLGFLDGKNGLIWHFLQGFWYRFLVDAIIYDVFKNAGTNKNAVKEYILKQYQINLN